MNITIFGGSAPKPDSPAYQDAYQLGYLLASAGHTVLTGGYCGTMEAASRGASEAGGHVIGVTCDEVENFRAGGANAWVKEERRYPTLRSRLYALIDGCDAAIALPGGPGTLTEISLTWNQLILGSLAPRPMILVGSGWKKTFSEMFKQLDGYTPEEHRALLQFAENVGSAAAMIAAFAGQKKKKTK
jgi:uncharacterized protein (TIGR00730 family)